MNNLILLPVTMLANLFGGSIKKYINDKYENNIFSYQFYNCIVSVSSAVCLLIFSNNLKISLFTFTTAFIFGIITLLQQIFNLYALENGPFSYTSVIISLSTLIPALSGALFWHETISFVQIIGIGFMVICFILSVDNKNKDKKTGKKWLLYSIGAFFATGFIGVMQKIHQTSSYKDESDAFLIISFMFSFAISMVLCISNKGKRIKNETSLIKINSFSGIILLLLSGIFVAVNNKLNLYLSGVINSAVFFPVVNGGGLVLSSLVSVVIFNEKLSKLQWLGLIFGIISVVLFCNPF